MNNPFQQQFNITTPAGKSILYGLGNLSKSRWSLQVTGNDGTGPSAQAGNFLNTGVNFGVPVTPTSWDVYLQAITDLNNGVGGYSGGGSKILEHTNLAQQNGDVVSESFTPTDSVQVVWSGVALGTANNILVTITGQD